MLKYALIEVVNNVPERDLTNVVYDETFLIQKKLIKKWKDFLAFDFYIEDKILFFHIAHLQLRYIDISFFACCVLISKFENCKRNLCIRSLLNLIRRLQNAPAR